MVENDPMQQGGSGQIPEGFDADPSFYPSEQQNNQLSQTSENKLGVTKVVLAIVTPILFYILLFVTLLFLYPGSHLYSSLPWPFMFFVQLLGPPILIIYSGVVLIIYFLNRQKKRKAFWTGLIFGVMIILLPLMGTWVKDEPLAYANFTYDVASRITACTRSSSLRCLWRGADCGELKQGEYQDSCYIVSAWKQCKPLICKKITVSKNQEECFKSVTGHKCKLPINEEALIAKAKNYYVSNPMIRIAGFSNTYSSIGDYLRRTPLIPHKVQDWTPIQIFNMEDVQPSVSVASRGAYQVIWRGMWKGWSIAVFFDLESLEPIETTIYEGVAMQYFQWNGAYYEGEAIQASLEERGITIIDTR